MSIGIGAPFLSKHVGFVKEEHVPRVYSPSLSPKPPVNLEEVIEVRGDCLAKRECNPFCLLWHEECSPPRSPTYGLVEECEWQES